MLLSVHTYISWIYNNAFRLNRIWANKKYFLPLFHRFQGMMNCRAINAVFCFTRSCSVCPAHAPGREHNCLVMTWHESIHTGGQRSSSRRHARSSGRCIRRGKSFPWQWNFAFTGKCMQSIFHKLLQPDKLWPLMSHDWFWTSTRRRGSHCLCWAQITRA